MAVVVLPTPPFWLVTAITRPTKVRILAGKTSPRRTAEQRCWVGEDQFPEEKLCNSRMEIWKPLIR
jgi:hypothetical protein